MRATAIIVFITVMLAGLISGPGNAQARKMAVPSSMIGITLGDDVIKHADILDMDASLPLFQLSSLHRVPIRNLPGYRDGYITYGTCSLKGEVVRIKLKYADDSEEFFEKLLHALRQRYGRGTWQGDAFGTLRMWKWSFTNADGDSISLNLQRYTGEDDTFASGNSIRLANRDAMQRESACGRAAAKEQEAARKDEKKPFSWYIPQ